MIQLVKKIKRKINLNRIRMAIKFLVVLFPAFLARLWLWNVWLVSERPDQARDNGYCFYKYLQDVHPEQRSYYIINRDSNDFKKVQEIGAVIHYNSWKHLFFFCATRIHISSQTDACCPTNSPFVRFMKPILKFKNVFIPHGVSYGIAEFCLARYAKIDLYITSGKYEYENVLKNYGYSEDQVIYTGFPRLDMWHNLSINSRLIVLMPTWRLYLAQDPNIIFENTVYYKSYSSLINNDDMAMFLKEHNLQLVFYLHHNMRKYVNSFYTECPNIEVVYQDETYDIQELLKSAAILITDYSSVHFDFAYMGKPVLYYQFDIEEFQMKQYKQSGFDANKDGFGPVAHDLETLLVELKQLYMEGFKLQGEYERRMKDFYRLRDEHNSDRVYKEIVKHFC